MRIKDLGALQMARLFSNMIQEEKKKDKKKFGHATAYRDWETDRKSTRLNSSH